MDILARNDLNFRHKIANLQFIFSGHSLLSPTKGYCLGPMTFFFGPLPLSQDAKVQFT
jgi:hypothetical protein